VTYSTVERGKRRRAPTIAVGETSKATVVKPSDALMPNPKTSR